MELSKELVYKAFQNIEQINLMFDNRSRMTVGGLLFERVAGNSTDAPDEDIQSEDRFCIWKCNNIHVKLTGYVTSYGDKTLQRWDFVEPKEKVVMVYE